MDGPITASALATEKTQLRMTDSQSQQGAPYCQAISTDRKLVDANHSLEQKPLNSRVTEPMEISPHPMQQIEELDKKYAARMRPPCSQPASSPPPLKKKKIDHTLTQHTAYKETDKILMGYCQSELADLISSDKLKLLQDLLSSERSVLEPPLRHLISILDSPEEIRKVIKNNPVLALGTLVNMDEVVFKRRSKILSFIIKTEEDIQIIGESCSVIHHSSDFHLIYKYSGISFKDAQFPGMTIEAIFERCDFSRAHFINAAITGCDFQESNFTGAVITKGHIRNCDFHEAILTDVDFGNTQYIIYSDKSDKCFENTVNLLFNAIIAYSKREKNDKPAVTTALRSLAQMLMNRKQPEKASAVYDELLEKQDLQIPDFVHLGQAYVDAICISSEEGHEQKTHHLAENAIKWMQVGWQNTHNTTGCVNYNHLFSMAVDFMCYTSSSYNWQKVLEDIEDRETIKETNVLLSKAELFVAKQEDEKAMVILEQMATDSEHCRKRPAKICEVISAIGLRNKTLSTQALRLLEDVTAREGIGQIRREPLTFSDEIKHIKTFACWLYRIDLLLQSERSEEALKLISAMEKDITGAKEMLSGEKYGESSAWKNGGFEFEELVMQIRTAVAAIDL